MDKFVIIASNSSGQVTALGTPSGQVFKSEASAQKRARVLTNNYLNLNFLVVPLTPSEAWR